MKYRRSQAELSEALADQISAIRSSCLNYDQGQRWEAQRLATAIYTLLCDGKKSKSILTQLNIRGSMRFYSSNPVPSPIPPGIQRIDSTRSAPLCMLGGGEYFVPRLEIEAFDPLKGWIQYQEWWEKKYFCKSNGYKIIEKELNLLFAKQRRRQSL